MDYLYDVIVIVTAPEQLTTDEIERRALAMLQQHRAGQRSPLIRIVESPRAMPLDADTYQP
jgi:hypothetical protein